MTMRQQERLHLRSILNQEADIGNHDIDSQQFLVRKHQSGIDDYHLVPVPEDHHIHPELTQTTQGYGFNSFWIQGCLYLSFHTLAEV